jgi:hypothetical protein
LSKYLSGHISLARAGDGSEKLIYPKCPSLLNEKYINFSWLSGTRLEDLKIGKVKRDTGEKYILSIKRDTGERYVHVNIIPNPP